PEQEGHGEEIGEVDDEAPGQVAQPDTADADDLRDECQPRTDAGDAGEVEEKPAGDAERQRHQADHPEQRTIEDDDEAEGPVAQRQAQAPAEDATVEGAGVARPAAEGQGTPCPTPPAAASQPGSLCGVRHMAPPESLQSRTATRRALRYAFASCTVCSA